VEAVCLGESTSSSITIGRSIPRLARLHDTASGPPTSRTLRWGCLPLHGLGACDHIATHLLSPFQSNIGMECASIVVASHQVGFCRCHLRDEIEWVRVFGKMERRLGGSSLEEGGCCLLILERRVGWRSCKTSRIHPTNTVAWALSCDAFRSEALICWRTGNAWAVDFSIRNPLAR
jgi:hypothetical protein